MITYVLCFLNYVPDNTQKIASKHTAICEIQDVETKC